MFFSKLVLLRFPDPSKLVVETDDLDVLQQVANYFKIIKSKNSDWWDSITDEHKALIETAIQQMEKGEGISDHVKKRLPGHPKSRFSKIYISTSSTASPTLSSNGNRLSQK